MTELDLVIVVEDLIPIHLRQSGPDPTLHLRVLGTAASSFTALRPTWNYRLSPSLTCLLLASSVRPQVQCG